MAAAVALTLAVAVQGVIDHNTTKGQKLYSLATHKLDKDLYDCKPDALYQFLQLVNNQAQEYGWNDKINRILHIPEDPQDMNSDMNYLVDNYGIILLQEIRNFEQIYRSANPSSPRQYYDIQMPNEQHIRKE
jgi:hypothetical protein